MPNCCICQRKVQASLHKFPTKNRHLYEKWLAATGFVPTSCYQKPFICGKHFADDCYRPCGQRSRLGPYAVPTLYLNGYVPAMDEPIYASDKEAIYLQSMMAKNIETTQSSSLIISNSLYRCLSQYLYDTPNNFKIIRILVATYVQMHWDIFQHILPQFSHLKFDSGEDYFRAATDDVSVAGIFEIIAFTAAFPHLAIDVFDPSIGKTYLYGSDKGCLMVLRLKDAIFEVLDCRKDMKRSYLFGNIESSHLQNVTDDMICNPQIKIHKDSNSLFRCYAQFLFGNETYFHVIRVLIVYLVASRWDEFSTYVTSKGIQTVENYVMHMTTSGSFGSDLEVAAFSYLFPSYSVAVYISNPDDQRHLQPVSYGSADGPQLFLRSEVCRDSAHYDIIDCDNIEIKVIVNNEDLTAEIPLNNVRKSAQTVNIPIVELADPLSPLEEHNDVRIDEDHNVIVNDQDIADAQSLNNFEESEQNIDFPSGQLNDPLFLFDAHSTDERYEDNQILGHHFDSTDAVSSETVVLPSDVSDSDLILGL